MKKYIVLVLTLICVLSIAGCKKENDEWIVWLNNLSLEQIKFDVGDTLNDNIEGGSRYVFEANSDKKQIEYIDYGSYGVYLLVDSDWYKVSNPTEPFIDIRILKI